MCVCLCAAICMGRILCLKLWINCDNGIFTHLLNSLTAFSFFPSLSSSAHILCEYLISRKIAFSSLVSEQNFCYFSRSPDTNTLFLSHCVDVCSSRCSSFVRCRIACFVDISSHIIYLLHLFRLCRENS